MGLVEEAYEKWAASVHGQSLGQWAASVHGQSLGRWEMARSAWEAGHRSPLAARDLLASWAAVRRLPPSVWPADLSLPDGLAVWRNGVDPAGARRALVELDAAWDEAGLEVAAEQAARLLRWMDHDRLAAWAAATLGYGDPGLEADLTARVEALDPTLFSGVVDLVEEELAAWDTALIFRDHGLWQASELWRILAEVREELQPPDLPQQALLALLAPEQ